MSCHRKERFLLLFRIYYITPIKVAAFKSVYEDFGGRAVCRDRYVVHVAEPQKREHVGFVALRAQRVAEKQYKVNFVVRYSRAYLLVAALRSGKKSLYVKSGTLAYELTRRACRKERVARQYTRICYTELYHKLFLLVVCYQCNIHGIYRPFPVRVLLPSPLKQPFKKSSSFVEIHNRYFFAVYAGGYILKRRTGA